MTLAESYDITWTEFILRKKRKQKQVEEKLKEIRLNAYLNLRNNWQGKKNEFPSIEKYWPMDKAKESDIKDIDRMAERMKKAYQQYLKEKQ